MASEVMPSRSIRRTLSQPNGLPPRHSRTSDTSTTAPSIRRANALPRRHSNSNSNSTTTYYHHTAGTQPTHPAAHPSPLAHHNNTVNTQLPATPAMPAPPSMDTLRCIFASRLRRVPDPEMLTHMHQLLVQQWEVLRSTAQSREDVLLRAVQQLQLHLQRAVCISEGHRARLLKALGEIQLLQSRVQVTEEQQRQQEQQVSGLEGMVMQLQREKEEEVEAGEAKAAAAAEWLRSAAEKYAGQVEEAEGRAREAEEEVEELRQRMRAMEEAAADAEEAEALLLGELKSAREWADAEELRARAAEDAVVEARVACLEAEERERHVARQANAWRLLPEDECHVVRGRVLAAAQGLREQVAAGGSDGGDGASGGGTCSRLVAVVAAAVAGGEDAGRGVTLLSTHRRGIHVFSVPDPRVDPAYHQIQHVSLSRGPTTTTTSNATTTTNSSDNTSSSADDTFGVHSRRRDLLPAVALASPCPSGQLVVKRWLLDTHVDGLTHQAELVNALALQGTRAGDRCAVLVDWGVVAAPAYSSSSNDPQLQLLAVYEWHAGGSLYDAVKQVLTRAEAEHAQAVARGGNVGARVAAWVEAIAAGAVKEFAVGVLRCLEPLHGARLIHNDVKGENFVLDHPLASNTDTNKTNTGTSSMAGLRLDLSRAVRIDSESHRLLPAGCVTVQGSGMWTEGFRAPEQLRGEGRAWACTGTDLFALGCELRGLVAWVERMGAGSVGADQGVLGAVARLAERCCAEDAWERPTVAEALAALAEAA